MIRSWTHYDLPTLQADLLHWQINPAHARQLLKNWYENCGGLNWATLPPSRRMQETLRLRIAPMASQVVRRHESGDGTIKLLLSLADGLSTEAVLMPSHRADRAAACISSQVGCAMRCDFCATARPGLARDLHAAEIVDQFVHLTREARDRGRRITSLVFMGMGEPLLNFDNVVQAIRRIGDPMMGALGWRQITVSTVGIVPKIDALAALDLNVHLALSLHAADDETRARIVPATRKFGVVDVMNALKRFQHATGRITTVQWCLLKDVNDSDEQAQRLCELMRGFKAHVNLIPHNAIGSGISGTIYTAPAPQRVRRFISILRDAGIVVHARVARGDSIAAACGQLATTVPLQVTPLPVH